jgi:hypothetical protein
MVDGHGNRGTGEADSRRKGQEDGSEVSERIRVDSRQDAISVSHDKAGKAK